MAIVGLFIFWCIVEFIFYLIGHYIENLKILKNIKTPSSVCLQKHNKYHKDMSAAEVLLFYKNKEKNTDL